MGFFRGEAGSGGTPPRTQAAQVPGSSGAHAADGADAANSARRRDSGASPSSQADIDVYTVSPLQVLALGGGILVSGALAQVGCGRGRSQQPTKCLPRLAAEAVGGAHTPLRCGVTQHAAARRRQPTQVPL